MLNLFSINFNSTRNPTFQLLSFFHSPSIFPLSRNLSEIIHGKKREKIQVIQKFLYSSELSFSKSTKALSLPQVSSALKRLIPLWIPHLIYFSLLPIKKEEKRRKWKMRKPNYTVFEMIASFCQLQLNSVWLTTCGLFVICHPC